MSNRMVRCLGVLCLSFGACGGDQAGAVDAAASSTDAPASDAPLGHDGPSTGPDAASDGAAATQCTTTAAGPTRGSPIAMTPDESTLLIANRDAGTVTVVRVSYVGGTPTMTKAVELAVGGEPWQVAIDPCGKIGWV